MEIKGWENIYKVQGEVQSEVLQVVKEAVVIFKERGYRKILDLGCGTGRHTIYLAQEGFEVYATDISETGLAITKKKAETLNLNNIKCLLHDMTDIPFDNNSFDAVLCIWTTGHGILKDVQKNIDEMYRVLKYGGMAFVDYVSVGDETYGLGKEIELNTFVGSRSGEEEIPHHYSTLEELQRQFSCFTKVNINEVE